MGEERGEPGEYTLNIDLSLTVCGRDFFDVLEKVRHAIAQLPLCHEDITDPIMAEVLFVGKEGVDVTMEFDPCPPCAR